MDTDNKKFMEMILELQAYIDELNEVLRPTVKQTKEQCEEIADLAGEIDATFRK